MAINYGRPGYKSQQSEYATSWSITNRIYPSRKIRQTDSGTRCIILPSRDIAMNPNDEAWATSVMPYRHIVPEGMDDPRYVNEDSGFGQFTGWYQNVQAYFMFGKPGKGNENRSFISPYMLDRQGKYGVDALNDVWWYIKKEIGRDEKHPLNRIIKKSGDQFAYLNRRSELVALNMLVEDKDGKSKEAVNGWVQQVIFISRMAADQLISHGGTYTDKSGQERRRPIGQLNTGRLATTQARSNDPFDMFEYGDVTNPQKAMVGRFFNFSSADNGPSAPGVDFTPTRSGRPEYVNLQILFGTEGLNNILAKRCPIGEEHWNGVATYNMHTYQEMVDFMIKDGVIPIDLIEAACGAYATINRSEASSEYKQDNYQDEVDMGEAGEVYTPPAAALRKPAQPPVKLPQPPTDPLPPSRIPAAPHPMAQTHVPVETHRGPILEDEPAAPVAKPAAEQAQNGWTPTLASELAALTDRIQLSPEEGGLKDHEFLRLQELSVMRRNASKK